LKTLLKSQGISLSIDRAENGQLGQGKNTEIHDLFLQDSSLIQQDKGGRSLVWLGHQLPKLTTRVQIPATALPFSSILSSIYLLGGNTTKQTGIYGYDKIFELAMKRLQEEPNDADEDKASISKLVEHLLW
jgi:hypothetical protein